MMVRFYSIAPANSNAFAAEDAMAQGGSHECGPARNEGFSPGCECNSV